ncbi:MAG: aspartate kinase [Pirellulaceae bacterium]
MTIIVQKYGGTSVADPDKILAAAGRAIRASQEGHQVVMVVSAMGKNTDMLVELARQINQRPSARELDMLLSTGEQVSAALMAMAIDSLGHRAVSLTGSQIGIQTDSTHTKARIISISTKRIEQLLSEGQIVIAAGFQGIDENYDITTLGRGGSDTTAVALAAVLGAVRCEIYTDVDGIYTTDPNILSSAQRMPQVSYDEMLELASLGAGVMHSRSIEFAKKYAVPIQVLSSLVDGPGTLIRKIPADLSKAVCGAVLAEDEALVTLAGVPDIPGSSSEIFSQIASQKITVDMIIQNVGKEGQTGLSFTVPRDELEMTLGVIEQVRGTLQIKKVSHSTDVSKVSVVGSGMAYQPGVAKKMFRSISDADINVLMITTSQIKISVLVRRSDAPRALEAVHQTFELDTPVENGSSNPVEPPPPRAEEERADVVDRLRGMEDLVIDDISLDTDQSRITLERVPDQPGIAALVFERVASAGIVVDMIVQSHLDQDGLANISFTIPRADLVACQDLCQQIAEQLPCQGISNSPQAAKLSVSGIGLRSHTGVARRMFQALGSGGINVELTNTSEARVNVIVAAEQGDLALSVVKAAFADITAR